MEPTGWAALTGLVAGFGLGFVVCAFLPGKEKHVHDWATWQDAEIVVFPTVGGFRNGQQYDAQGQERRCRSCNLKELRKIG